jgi:two-component sensor histidine kinase
MDGGAARVTMQGPAIVLRPEAAQSLGLALHELSTNAVRHGALSNAGGRVAVAWRRLEPADGGGLEITWTEAGGPVVLPPHQRGLGATVIERNLARSLDAEVELSFDPAGARFRVIVPESHILGQR